MATDTQLIQALENAAAKVVGRALTADEKAKVLAFFNQSQAPNTFSRTQEAIINFSRISQRQLQEKAAASDDTNRAIKDLEEIAKNWRK